MEQFAAAKPAEGALAPSRGAEQGARAIRGQREQQGLEAGAGATPHAPPRFVLPLGGYAGKAAASALLDMLDQIVNKVSLLQGNSGARVIWRLGQGQGSNASPHASTLCIFWDIFLFLYKAERTTVRAANKLRSKRANMSEGH